MILPIGDEPNSPSTPWATYGLIAVNACVWLFVCVPLVSQPLSYAMPGAVDYIEELRAQTNMSRLDLLGHATAFDLFTFRWGYRPAAPSAITLFSSLFLHGGWMHLLSNMLFLYIFGDNVEARLGRRRYLATYLACGAVATLFYAAFRMGSRFPLVGASGAISGILGCYFVWFPHNQVKVLYTIFIFISHVMVPARILLFLYLIVENLLPFVLGSAGGGSTAYGAHIGGFIAGAGFAIYDNQSAPGRRRAAAQASAEASGRVAGGSAAARRAFHAVRDVFERTSGGRRPPASVSGEGVRELLTAGAYGEAVAHYRALGDLQRAQLGHETQFAIADALTEQRQFAEALIVLRRWIGQSSPDPDICARAHLRMGLIYLRGLQRPASAYPHLLDVLELPASEPVRDAARDALATIEGDGRPQ